MEYQFPDNTNDMMVTFFRERTGSPFFRVFYKGACVIRYTPIEVGRVFGVAKFTKTATAVREWAKEQLEKVDS